MDSWRNWSHAGSWSWSPRGRPGSDLLSDFNAWGANEAEAYLDALRSLARLRAFRIEGTADAPLPYDGYQSRPETVRLEDFERALLEAVRAAPVPITNIDLELDLHVWVHTAQSPTTAIRGWCPIGDASLFLDPKTPSGNLAMDHTLFLDGQLHGDWNTELHRLNQPLLRAALAEIEARLGPIFEVEGLPGVSKTGFDSIRP